MLQIIDDILIVFHFFSYISLYVNTWQSLESFLFLLNGILWPNNVA